MIGNEKSEIARLKAEVRDLQGRLFERKKIDPPAIIFKPQQESQSEIAILKSENKSLLSKIASLEADKLNATELKCKIGLLSAEVTQLRSKSRYP